MTKQYDLLVIGGGINGTAIALDAAGRGLSVLLCEQDDLASGTSSASSKLIHGGLRYLKNFEFHMVKDALNEREILLKKAPHLIRPLEFVLPVNPKKYTSWLIRLGLILYDHLGKRTTLSKSQVIHLDQDMRGVICNEQFKKAYVYSDCWVDDARLVVTNALAAQQQGAQICTRTKVIDLHYRHPFWQISLHHKGNDQTEMVYAKCVVNAAGPWVNSVQALVKALAPIPPIRLVAGSHIVVPKLYAEDHAFILQADDNRIIFVMPFASDFSLIGTTEIEYLKDPKETHITAAEEEYLCSVVNHYFKKTITKQNIVWHFTGVRALLGAKANNATRLSRDYQLYFDQHKRFMTVVGGKITTHRRLAEDVMKKLKSIFPALKPAWTKKALLPGAEFTHDNFTLFLHDLFRHYFWLPQSLVSRLAAQYGSRLHLFLEGTEAIADLGQNFGHDLYQKEVDFLCEQEWAVNVEDIIWRRTKLGLKMTATEKMQLQQYLLTKHRND
jgi:glycerol-3-phosphate dehydrogenase